ncbi:hypothetical protein GCM10010350_75110 [Streptomyces galilaeus]|nr:hypothetical protein GCM10010350_75110 [Streptomyces galilaeus]
MAGRKTALTSPSSPQYFCSGYGYDMSGSFRAAGAPCGAGSDRRDGGPVLNETVGPRRCDDEELRPDVSRRLGDG